MGCGHVLATVDLWRSEDSFVEPFPSFHFHVGPMAQTRMIRPVQKHPSPLTDLEPIIRRLLSSQGGISVMYSYTQLQGLGLVF